MPDEIRSIPGLHNAYNGHSDEIREYFEHIPKLIDFFPLDVCLAYVFARLELGQNMALYCGAVRIHKANSQVAKGAVGTHHMTRYEFIDLYKNIFDLELPKEAHDELKAAENTRDAVMHGKPPLVRDLRNAISRVLEYAEAMNEQLNSAHGLKPFGSLQGFATKGNYNKKTSRLVLKGLGFKLS